MGKVTHFLATQVQRRDTIHILAIEHDLLQLKQGRAARNIQGKPDIGKR